MVKLCLQEATLKKEDKKELKQMFSRFLTEITEVERDSMLGIIKVILFNRSIIKWGGEKPGEVTSDPLLEAETDKILFEAEIEKRITNRRKYTWEQFLHIVDEGNTNTLCNITLDEEDTGCPSTDSESEDFF